MESWPSREQEMRAEMDLLRSRNKRLVQALLCCHRYCEHLHHWPHERHEGGDCPVEARIREALKPYQNEGSA